ncbi:hypothetical protein HMPREF2533_01287 [Bacteroides fragilis]|nr:hypothetical protein HMPREF2530_01287 [Bacteroides fragilis]KXU48178.1 hypothetical protein HMPREF2533_01287 [Bacteroides fragilis]
MRIDQECHDLLSAVERGETAFARTEIDQSEPLPTAATEQSLFIPPTDGGDSEIRIGTKIQQEFYRAAVIVVAIDAVASAEDYSLFCQAGRVGEDRMPPIV